MKGVESVLYVKDAKLIARLIAAARALVRHDEADDKREGRDNCVELVELREALGPFI